MPKSLISAELEKTNAAVESDVLGKRFDDDTAYTELPAEGEWERGWRFTSLQLQLRALQASRKTPSSR